jgi:hypothetical protein
MRVLFTCLAFSGHFYPLVPFARALRIGRGGCRLPPLPRRYRATSRRTIGVRLYEYW